MASVATDPRRRLQTLLRRARYIASEIPGRLGRSSPAQVGTIGVVGVDDPATLADAAARMAWSIPGDVDVVFAEAPAEPLPAWAGHDVPQLGSKLTIGDPDKADLLVLASAGGLRWMHRVVDSRAVIGDPHWYSGVEVENYVALSSVTTTSGQWEAIRERSAHLLAELQTRYSGSRRVGVFGTGPSMTKVDPAALGSDVTIACNSAVSNRHWMDAAKPAVIAFADPVFHFGPSRYASEFREDLRRTAAATDAYFVVPERYAPLIERRLPGVASRMITVGHARGAALTDLAPDHLVVPETANALTLLMLPIALALGTDVAIAGCDGRKPTERYFWAHNPEVQYSDDLMRSAFDAHPSFFRDRNYGRYYEQHCEQLETMLSRAESEGHRFRSVTPSEIPALKRRQQ